MNENANRLLIAAAVGSALALGTASEAGASQRTEHGTTVAASCDNGFSGQAVIHRHLPAGKVHSGRWFVLHVVGGEKDAKVMVPRSADVTFTFTSDTGAVTTNTENISKQHAAADETTCSLDGSASVDGGTLAVDGTAAGVVH